MFNLLMHDSPWGTRKDTVILGRLLAATRERASEVGLLRADDLDLRALRLSVHRLKGSLSGTHPLASDARLGAAS